MAWEARWGLKLLNGGDCHSVVPGLNGVGGPLGIETTRCLNASKRLSLGLNGVGGPLGIETLNPCPEFIDHLKV